MRIYINDGIAFYFLKAPTEEELAGEPIQWVTYPVKRYDASALVDPTWQEGVDRRYRQLAESLEDGAVICYSLCQVVGFFDFYRLYREIARLPRRKEIKLLLGGSLVGYLDSADMLERYPRITSMVVGPGERVLPELLVRILRGQEVPRLVHGDSADRNAWADVSIVRAPGRWYYCSHSLDKCSWARCKFCHHQRPEAVADSTIEQFSEKLIELHRDHGVARFYLFDNNLEPRNLEVLLETLRAARMHGKLEIALFGARLDPGFVELAPLVQELGVINEISWGLESCSQRLLNLYAKGTRVEHFGPILESYAKAGVSNIVYGLYGLPRATDEDLRESFPRIDALRQNTAELHLSWFLLSEGLAVYDERDRFGVEVLGQYRMSDTVGFDCLREHDVATRFLDFRSTIAGHSLTRRDDFQRHLPYIRKQRQTRLLPRKDNTFLYFLRTPHAIEDPTGVMAPPSHESAERSANPLDCRDVRELGDRYDGRRALILGKGPSLDVWLARGGLQDGRSDLVVVAINEAVLLPGLGPAYWFWTRMSQPAWAESFGGIPEQVMQVVPRRLLRERGELLARTIRGRTCLVYEDGRSAPDDEWGVPGRGEAGPAAFFCCGAWGIEKVTAVGFDAIDAPGMRSYAKCLWPWLLDPRHRRLGYRTNNRDIRAAITRFGLDVDWYHRRSTEEELLGAARLYDTEEYYDDCFRRHASAR